MAGAENVVGSRSQANRELRRFLLGLGRGAAGAMLFGIPMLMTMEFWALGFSMDRWRLLLMLLANIPMLILLADLIGFEHTTTWQQALRDATIAYGLGIAISGAILVMLGIIKADMSLSEILGKTAIQAIPASIGAMLGRSQLGGQDDDEEKDGEDGGAVPDHLSTHYVQELFLMAVGALFLNLNVAPTEEVILISYKMTPWHALAAILASIAIMHAFVYAVAFKGTHAIPEGIPWWHAFLRFTLPGYVIAMGISIYVLWTFGRLDDMAFTQMLMSAIVLSFPGSIGAASARLIL
ncbi:TIGR02587 family membrane protein [Neorhizobium lilium]|uniref:TIGR02587 family membrane protein n=1 Tax=Neorhizobium lilium TaxID=2503024 RepID=A0A444LN47_9HYPH|nr:TIGR02587 family membrane protein [Neorhizobium lilium]RWX81740.1 TIGR02587 family membrane protein [Neorhizobium lilium]